MHAVSIHNLQIRLGGQAVIDDLSLEVAAGEFLVLLGPSGCGKSTLLHGIAGLLDVSAGRIEIGGEDQTWADPADRNVGMVFQSYALYPTLSVARNMGFGLRARGMGATDTDARVRRVAELLQLTPLLDRKPAQLSGGQRQRVAIGRALVRDARVYLLDEPLSNLDASLRASLRRELKLLHQRLGATMIYVTHDQVEALTLATRIAIMQQGRIQQLGTPEEVYSRPANRFVAGFIGSPGMNFREGIVRTGPDGFRFEAPGIRVALPGYAYTGPVPEPGAAVLLGVRPEHLRLGAAAAADAGADAAMSGTVTLVEALGSHQVVWLDCAGATYAALSHELLTCNVGDTLPFRVDAGTISLFDCATGGRL